MFGITIPVADLTATQFQKICEYFNCTAVSVVGNKPYWHITSDDPLNFFWLGMNLHYRETTGITETVVSKIIRENPDK